MTKALATDLTGKYMFLPLTNGCQMVTDQSLHLCELCFIITVHLHILQPTSTRTHSFTIAWSLLFTYKMGKLGGGLAATFHALCSLSLPYAFWMCSCKVGAIPNTKYKISQAEMTAFFLLLIIVGLTEQLDWKSAQQTEHNLSASPFL